MNKKQKKVLYRIIVTAVLLGAVCLFPAERLLPAGTAAWVAKLLLFLIPYLIIGYDILRKAVLGIIHGEVFDENFLMAVATVGALCLGEYTEAVAVMLFYQIGELFQAVAVGKSRKNIAALMDIRPDYANLLMDNGELEQVDPEEVPVGTVIVISPGERVPIDGVVVQGQGTLNTSALTGESMPREVAVGDEVISGCVNQSGLLQVRTTKVFEESTVAKILDLVENSSMKKSRTENFITRFAKYYTPAVCYCALALALLPPILLVLMGKDALWNVWISRALSFLVISCPCALVISIPLSFFGGIGGASSQGILVKGSNYLELLSRTKYVVFDKTGTLTEGSFKVMEIHPASVTTEQELLRLAAYAEGYSNHPISKSLQEAYGQPIERNKVTGVSEISGQGIRANVDGQMVLAGNAKLMEAEQIAYEQTEAAGTVVYVACEGVYQGYLLIADCIKEQAPKALADLKAAGVRKTVMLTGDARIVAEQVGKALGVDEIRSNLLPGDKVAEVERLLEQKQPKEVLAFVGDGINDAPVLSRADVGIAMGALGSDAAIEAADIVLMDDNPAKIALAMQISGKCLRIVYQNIIFALGVKGICLILGAIGYVDMWLAIFADVGVMVLAVLNAVRCLKVKTK